MHQADTHHMNDIEKAATAIRAGQLVGMPTETVYGLAGNALDDRAVAAIYAAKGRPHFNPLIVHVADMVQAQQFALCDARAQLLAQHFWPGPLTLVLPRREDCGLSLLLSAGLPSVALRAPTHKVAQALLAASGVPLAAPSANRSGRISPTLAKHVREELGEAVALVLEGGACQHGIESTVLDLTTPQAAILRPGSITAEAIAAVIGPLGASDGTLKSPGQLASHYAPGIPLRLNACHVQPHEALLAFGAQPLATITGTPHTLRNLSEQGDLTEAAANLFRMLRELDASGAHAIAAMPIPPQGLGIAILDRLERASVR
jgi:L-threonylcarbamoyladenylate synthase